MMKNQAKKVRIALQLIILCLAVLFFYLLIILFPFYKSLLLMFFQIILPFLIAGLIAYLLHPVVEKIHQYNIPRTIAILLIYLFFFLIAGLGIYFYFPTIVRQLNEFRLNIPQLIESYQTFLYSIYDQTSFLPEGFHDKLDEFFLNMENRLGNIFTAIMDNIPMVFDVFVMIAVIPILSFYFLKDYSRLEKGVLKLIPTRYHAFTKRLANEMEESLGQYIRGQILVCFLVGFIAYLLLKWIGMEYSILLGVIIGLTNFIPYFGPIIGAIPALLIAFTISTKMVLFVLLVILAVQLTEGNLLSPFIVGKSIRIHPVYIILALFIAAKVGGVIGMILAVPLLAIGRVAVPLIYRQMKQIDR